VTEVRRLGPGDDALVMAAAALFDAPPRQDATARFLSAEGHHLLLAYNGGEPVGMVSGIEMTHPDKGTELCLYELGVHESARRQGVARALVDALLELAHEHGCYGMWVPVDADNEPALAMYRATGGVPDDGAQSVLTWTFD
jgi:ribosomal protein S18 acetylase RimI-like enzyme